MWLKYCCAAVAARMLTAATLLLGVLTTALPAQSQRLLAPAGEIRLEGKVRDAKQISAVALSGPWVLFGGDEGRGVQPFRRLGGSRLEAGKMINLVPSGGELDVEGIACRGATCYVLGSHALVRKKLDDGKKQESNRKQLTEVEHEPSRDHLFRFTLSVDGQASDIRSINLRQLLAGDRVLGPFTRIPSKENGLDLEGLALVGDDLYVGLRGPVLRGNLTPVIRLQFDRPQAYEVRFVPLEGLGIRELAPVSDGFLVIAGPVGDAPLPCLLYHWNGQDGLPGKDAQARVRLLGEFPRVDGGKAEGMAVLAETATEYSLLVVFDGAKEGGPTVFKVPKAGAE